jgi:septum formation protein
MADTRVKLVLASASPRRLMLLERMGLAPDLLNPTDLDETPKRRETPRRLSIRLAEEKAKAAIHAPQVQALGAGVFILAADTVVGLGRRILPKAETRKDAYACLTLLSGRSHWVYSTVCIIAPNGQKTTRCCETKVRLKRCRAMTSKAISSPMNGAARRAAMPFRPGRGLCSHYGLVFGRDGPTPHETVHLLEGAGYPCFTLDDDCFRECLMAEPVRLKPRRPCPICSKPCCRNSIPLLARCLIDLNRWLGGNYAIPAVESRSIG